jgi:hypothetical protein
VDRQRDRDRAFGVHQTIAIVLVDAEVIGDDLKLVTRHFKNFVVVNRHEAKAESRISAKKTQMLFASKIGRVNSKAARLALIATPKLPVKARAESNGSTIASEFVTSSPK